jgi:HlyD family secretion protein
MVRFSLTFVSLLALTACSQKPADSYSGYVEAQAAVIAAPQSGWLTAVAVDRGDVVRPDQTLFTLDATQAGHMLQGAEQRAAAAEATAEDLSKGAREADVAPLIAQRAQAMAQAELARSNEARYAKLEPKGFVSAAQMDTLRAATKSAQAAVISIDKQIADLRQAARTDQQRAAEAQAQAASADAEQAAWSVDDRNVKSRLDGRVEERLHEPGEFVAQGTPVLTVLPKGRQFVRFYVPQDQLSKFTVGKVVRVHCDGCAAGLTAKVRYISPQAEFTPPVIYSVKERQKLIFLIEATPSAPERLRAGQPVDVSL